MPIREDSPGRDGASGSMMNPYPRLEAATEVVGHDGRVAEIPPAEFIHDVLVRTHTVLEDPAVVPVDAPVHEADRGLRNRDEFVADGSDALVDGVSRMTVGPHESDVDLLPRAGG